jgi:long-chain acyl-CoA synthetase
MAGRSQPQGDPTMTVTADDVQAMAEGTTLCTAFVDTVAAHGPRVAVRWRNDDESWGEWTFDDFADRVARAVAGLQAQGVGTGDRVVLMVRNIPEFHVLDLAISFCGATPVSIYNSSAPEQIEYLVNHCEASLAIVEDAGFLERFTSVRDQLPKLRGIGIVHGGTDLADDLFTYDSLLAHGPVDLVAAARNCTSDQIATIIYTSGTTGPPKGVVISHRNVSWTVECLLLATEWDREALAGKRVVSYLPMAHIAERMTSHYQGIFAGYEVTTCPNPAHIAAYLQHVRPNIVFGVPRVWEKINAGVMAALSADDDKHTKFLEALDAAAPIVEAMAWGRATDEQLATYEFLDEVAFRPIRELLGLDAVELAVTGAAPIPADLLRWFRGIGVPLAEIYGMSESSGPITWAPIRVKPGTVGPAVPGVEVALAPDGEVIFRGGNVFGGYLNAPDKTAETIDDEGWVHTGDIGTLDDDGYLTIVDRKKELIITAGGKNISPANLEAALKLIPLVGQACAVGDQRPFVSALVVLDAEVAPVWARQHDIEFSSLDDLAVHPLVVETIERGVEGVMAEFNNAERVKKVKILGEEWLPDSELLTPTSKLKRRGILARYQAEIDALYA